MFNLKSIGIVLVSLWAVSCTKTIEDGNNRLDEGTTRTSFVALATEEVGDLSVYVFNKTGDTFLFSSLLDDGWVERDGKKFLFKELEHGDYKFLFLANKCSNLSIPEIPADLEQELRFEDMIISHKVLSTKEGCFAGADEIYMQDDADLADLTYMINGNRSIEAHLTRAVGKVDVQLGRGYVSTDARGNRTVVPAPYTDGESIADLFQGYEIEVIDCGDHLAIRGCNGAANVYEDYVAGHEAIRTVQDGDEDNEDGLKTGFAVLSGPFILPPSSQSNMKVRVKLIPAEGSGLSVFEKVLENGVDGNLNISRNHKLTITFWLDATSYPTISVTANIADMDEEIIGDSGMWY